MKTNELKHWKVPGQSRAFDSAFKSNVEIGPITKRSILVMEIIDQNKGITVNELLDKYNEITGEETTQKKHLFSPLVFINLISELKITDKRKEKNKSNKLFLTKEGGKVIKSYLNNDYITLNKFLIKAFLNCKYPNTSVNENDLDFKLYPFRILFNILYTNDFITKEDSLNKLPFIKDERDYKEIINNTYTPQKLNDNSSKKFDEWYISTLVALDYIKNEYNKYSLNTEFIEEFYSRKELFLSSELFTNPFFESVNKNNLIEKLFYAPEDNSKDNLKPGVSYWLTILSAIRAFYETGNLSFTNKEILHYYKINMSELFCGEQDGLEYKKRRYYVREFLRYLTTGCGSDSQPNVIKQGNEKEYFIKIDKSGVYTLNYKASMHFLNLFTDVKSNLWSEILSRYSKDISQLWTTHIIENDLHSKNIKNDISETEKKLKTENSSENKDKEDKFRTHKVYERDPKNKAILGEYIKIYNNSVCEYCGKRFFLKNKEEFYFEAHHIDPVSKRGKDDVHNLIGICANCHRKAHYSIGKEKMAREMEEIVSDRKELIDSICKIIK